MKKKRISSNRNPLWSKALSIRERGDLRTIVPHTHERKIGTITSATSPVASLFLFELSIYAAG